MLFFTTGKVNVARADTFQRLFTAAIDRVRRFAQPLISMLRYLLPRLLDHGAQVERRVFAVSHCFFFD